MDESMSFGNVSTTSSNDLLWEALKMDLDQNRAHHSHQIQSLKEQPQPLIEKRRSRKSGKMYRLRLKQIAKKKAYKLALQSLKTLLASKQKRKRQYRPHFVDCSSTMDFKIVPFDHHKSSHVEHSKSAIPLDDVAMKGLKKNEVLDKCVQTIGTSLVENCSQTALDGSPILSTFAFQPVHSCIPLHFTPIPVCGVHFGKALDCHSTHCGVSSGSMCDQSAGLKDPRAKSSVTTELRVTSDSQTVTSQYSLKEICEELLAQISSKEKAVVQINTSEVEENSTHAENPTGNLISTFHSTSSSQEQSSSSKIGQKVMNSNELLNMSSAYSEPTVTQPHQSTLHLAHCVVTVEEDTQTVPSPPLTSQIVTPDLLRNSDNAHLRKPDDQGQALFSKKEKMRISHLESVPLQRKINFEGNQNKQQEEPSELNGGLPENKNERKELDVVQVSDTVGNKENNTQAKVVLSRLEPGRKDSEKGEVLSPVSHQCVEKSQSTKCTDKNDKENPTQAVEKSVDSNPVQNTVDSKTNDVELNPSQENVMQKQSDTSIEPDCGANVELSTVTVDADIKAAKNPTVLGLRETNPKFSESKISKVLAKIHNMDLSNISREKFQNSPDFEEIDSSEMETLLLIWRQQEQLHKDNPDNQSAPSSPGNIFRKLRRPLELPPELRSTRTSQSPPVKENSEPVSSALDILDVETSTKGVSEDDDISESSPHFEISPPKRRRLKLSLNPPLLIQKSKENFKKDETISPAFTTTPTENSSESTPASTKEAPSGVRSSKRLRTASSQKADEVPLDQTISDQKEKSKKDVKVGKAKTLSDKKSSNAKTKGKKVDELAAQSLVASTKDSKGVNVKKNIKEIKEAVQQTAMDSSTTDKHTARKEEDDKNNFHDQIQERVNKLKTKWLQEKSDDEIDVVGTNSSPPNTGLSQNTDSQNSESSQDLFDSQSKPPITELARAHDLATHILLNPWRGINARRVTRRFVCPTYEAKVVTRALWDLRSNAEVNNVVERILALGWTGYHPKAVRALVAMFTLSFTRKVPFVIDGMRGEEDDTTSLSSDAGVASKKKSTAVRLVATKQIFKGECIEGLHGILIKTSDKDKEILRSWNFPKLKDKRDRVLLGPLAYLKRDESNFNTQAVYLKEELVCVKASRMILSGETLLVTFKELEKKYL